ncbi:MAG: alpha-amylase family glycosyl hydrolase [Victivallaceae bacterium]|nr:alpha-amylase family glycosyl hydrolase [Victivallaceae bacterium]
MTPRWLKKAVFYQVYPQSFYDSNGDGIGDIPGVIAKLDYIKNLGVDAVWFNPWYESPFRDAGYDITDFYKVAKRYGTNADAKKLFAEAHKRGIKIVLDLVIGHTSLDCKWFKESEKPERNAYSDYYVWCPIAYYRGTGKGDDYFVSGWGPRGAFLANYYAVQPALNFGYAKIEHPWELRYDDPRCRATREEMIRVMRFWMDMGADGFRVDMASSAIKRDAGKKKTIAFWKEVRRIFDRDYPENVLISEWFDPATSLKAGFHIDFYYNSFWRCGYRPEKTDPKWPQMAMAEKHFTDPVPAVKPVFDLIQKTQKKGYIGFYSGNHDGARLPYFGSEANTIVKLAMLFTLPGTPFLYYGDEIGMRYRENLTPKAGGERRTGSRTPMQWDNALANAGFSAAAKEKLYLPVDDAVDAPCVAGALKGNNATYNAVTQLLALRKRHIALDNDAKVELIYLKHRKMPIAYTRTKGKEKLLVLLNSSKEDVSVKMPKFKNAEVLLAKGVKMTDGTFALAPCSYGIYKIRKL